MAEVTVLSSRSRILFYADGPRVWAALMVDGRLEDLFAEDRECFAGPRLGEVCVAQVDRVAAGGRVAFLDVGNDRSVYLGRANAVGPGDRLLVVVDRYAYDGKQARVSEAVPAVGTRLIAMAEGDGVGVSRSISDQDERARLEQIMEPFVQRNRFVVRTAAAGATADELAAEAESLLDQLDNLRAAAQQGEPRTLVAAPGPIERAFERWDEVETAALVGAGRDIAGTVDEEFRADMEMLADENALLEVDDLGGQIRQLAGSRVDLDAGAWLAIEPTTALVSVDVNTGRGDIEDRRPVATGLMACRELPRELRIRGLAGIVVVDFPRVSSADEEAVDGELRAALQQDYVGGRVFGWTSGGLYEFTRRRDRRPVNECFADLVSP